MLSLRAFLICLRTSPRFGGATFLQLRYAARDAFKVSSTSVVVSIAHARQSYSRVERKRGRTLRSRGRDLAEDLARRSVDRGLNGACFIEKREPTTTGRTKEGTDLNQSIASGTRLGWASRPSGGSTRSGSNSLGSRAHVVEMSPLGSLQRSVVRAWLCE